MPTTTPADLTAPLPRRRVRMTGWWMGGGVALVVVVVGGWQIARWAATDAPNDSSQTFCVERLSFPVVLKERGELKAKNNVEVRCELPGQSRIVFVVEEGNQVKAGELILELDSEELTEKIRQEEIHQANAKANYEAALKEHEILVDQNKSDIRAAELRVNQADRELEKYLKGDYVKALQDCKLAIERAQQVLVRKTADLKNAEKLRDRGYITKADLEDDEFEKYEAEVALQKALLAKEILDKYTHPNDKEKKEADFDQAQKDLQRRRKSALAKEEKSIAQLASKKAELELRTDRVKRLHGQAEKTKIYAPTDGFVVHGDPSGHRWRDDRRIETGAQVYQAQVLLQLPDPSVMQVSCRVHESKTELIKLGQRATVQVEGITGQEFTGTVTKISALADSQSRWLNPDLKEYTTEITLDQTHPSLKPGGTGICRITVAELDNVLAVPVQAIFARGTKRFVFLENGGSAEPVEVTLGMAGTEYITVKSGLDVGQMVLLSADDELMRKLPTSSQVNASQESYAAGKKTNTGESKDDAGVAAQPAAAEETSTDQEPAEESDAEVAATSSTTKPAAPAEAETS